MLSAVTACEKTAPAPAGSQDTIVLPKCCFKPKCQEWCIWPLLLNTYPAHKIQSSHFGQRQLSSNATVVGVARNDLGCKNTFAQPDNHNELLFFFHLIRPVAEEIRNMDSEVRTFGTEHNWLKSKSMCNFCIAQWEIHDALNRNYLELLTNRFIQVLNGSGYVTSQPKL